MVDRTGTSTEPEPPGTWTRPQNDAYVVRFSDSGSEERHGEGVPAFTLVFPDRHRMRQVLEGDAYSAAIAFIRGEFDIQGDVAAAVRFARATIHRGWLALLHTAAARVAPHRIETWLQTRGRAALNVRAHYDRPNAFYQQFLDARMVYSCGYFRTPDTSLDEAQLAKLELICRKLDMRHGDRFLDIGSGWGALLMHAAEHHGAVATGCTLSRNQAEYSGHLARGLRGAKVAVIEQDYREIAGHFDKIASVGMFEHVGRHRLRHYFAAVHALLETDGLFLNHGIVRPEFVTDDPETLFVRRKVFPGTELPRLSDVIRAAELGGFEVLDVEDLRPHYALTCHRWIDRLQQHEAACLDVVDEPTYRTWVLYLAGAAAGFEDGLTSVVQLLLASRTSRHRRLTRDYIL